MDNGFEGVGLAPAEVLVPALSIDITRWAVVACDQFTSQPEYWREAEAFVGGAPSALNMILPEAYLNAPDADDRTRRILSSMRQSIQHSETDRGLFSSFFGFALVERRFVSGDSSVERAARVGLIAAVDLECYDYSPDSSSPIRSTEGTIIERLPPRMAIRREAALELPHILLLLQDKERSVIEPIYARRDSLRPLYDAPLMLDGGSVKGWAIDNPDDIESIGSALRSLPMADGIRVAVGDGNHSLAAARAVWLESREQIPLEQRATHPLRFALAEVCNIYDDGIAFEPIHRILYDAGMDAFLSDFRMWVDAQGGSMQIERVDQEFSHKTDDKSAICITSDAAYVLRFDGLRFQTVVGIVQEFLDCRPAYGKSNGSVDYIHGDDSLRELATQPNRIGILLPALDKSHLFPAIAKDGALPRKTFSMGHAREKRYYLEARKLR
jgi:uncharacterized protein (DUF1015 family)